MVTQSQQPQSFSEIHNFPLFLTKTSARWKVGPQESFCMYFSAFLRADFQNGVPFCQSTSKKTTIQGKQNT